MYTLNPPFYNRKYRHSLFPSFFIVWSRESLQFDLTTQRSSFVEGQDWEAKGAPEGAELSFLKSLGDVVPADMLSEPVVMPHISKRGTPIDRRNKRAALRLFNEAGWTVNDDGKMVDKNGQQMSLDFLVISTWDDTRLATIDTYVKTLRNWGVKVKADKVDSAQGHQRFLDKNYDLIHTSIRSFASAGTGLLQMFGAETAVVSSYNPSALRSPMVDAIINAALETKSRQEEVIALKALDRALRFERIIVHAGYVPENWVAYYDMYERPESLPPLALGVIDFWWFNEEKHQALKASGALR